MKRIWIYIVLLVSALLIPSKRTDLEKLKPVETVYLYYESEQLVIQTDTEDRGEGSDIQQALKNLKDTTAGRIYLDTADYLLIGTDAEHDAQMLKEELKGSVRVCRAEGELDIKMAGAYLKVHMPQKKLRDWKAGEAIQILKTEADRMVLK